MAHPATVHVARHEYHSPLPDSDLAEWHKDDELRSPVICTNRIEDVETIWRQLEAQGIESPAQSYDFIKLWAKTFQIAPADQLFITGTVNGQVVALLALYRRRVKGVRVFSWFPGPHVGCSAPLINKAIFATLTHDQRCALWQSMMDRVSGGDVVYLKAVPSAIESMQDVFDELGASLPSETLYRAKFADWEQANAIQRNRSRRKHDRQQGERLASMGEIRFEEINADENAHDILDVMFRQRAARFVAMKVNDPFAHPMVRDFYHQTLDRASGVKIKLHVLRLDGAIVAVRYNVEHGRRLFCLISSMSDDPAIQVGSPGKQCLLRVMQTIFDAGYTMFDMGAGFTDEKRHWCNVQIKVRNHYFALTPWGRVAGKVHREWQVYRARIKANERLHAGAKSIRMIIARLRGKPDPADAGGEGRD